jgi:hypothetical protein
MKPVNKKKPEDQTSTLARANAEVVGANSNATTRDDLAIPLDEAPGIIGLLKGKITVSDDFDDPLPDDILDLFEGKGE